METILGIYRYNRKYMANALKRMTGVYVEPKPYLNIQMAATTEYLSKNLAVPEAHHDVLLYAIYVWDTREVIAHGEIVLGPIAFGEKTSVFYTPLHNAFQGLFNMHGSGKTYAEQNLEGVDADKRLLVGANDQCIDFLNARYNASSYEHSISLCNAYMNKYFAYYNTADGKRYAENKQVSSTALRTCKLDKDVIDFAQQKADNCTTYTRTKPEVGEQVYARRVL